MSRVTSLRDTTCYKVATLYKMAKTERVLILQTIFKKLKYS